MKNSLFILYLWVMTFNVFAQSRIEVEFNDQWQFKKGPFASENYISIASSQDEEWDNVTIPHTWNADDMQEKKNDFYAGDGLYRKKFTPSEESKDKRTYLRFEGVGAVAQMYVNGKFAGRHLGGYSAFCFEITSLLKYGEENEIVLRANNASRDDIIPTNHNLFGVYGGIYRPVWLIVTDSINISPLDHASSGVYVSQKSVTSKSAQIEVKVALDNGGLKPIDVELENIIYDMEGKKVLSNRSPINLSSQGLQLNVTDFNIKKPHLWNGRKDPYLYRVETLLYKNGELIDKVVSPLGIRDFELRAGDGMYLNGEKYPMYGVCRHQDRLGIGSALLNEHHAEDLDMIMEIGATTVRFAHYQQSEYLYSKCDSLGLVIWAEIPFVNRVTTKEGENTKSQLSEMILQSYNHPSIYVWGLHNEVYVPTNFTAQLTKELHTLAKRLDPYRYTVSVNGYGHMEHSVNLQADIQGMNRYFGWYEGKIDGMELWALNLESEYPDNLFMLAEYGAEANITQQSELTGESYNYMSDFYPEGFSTKTHEKHWSIIANHPYILASYVWNMFDFAVPMWERGGVPARNMKGLVTFDRKVKKDVFYWYKANWSEQPVFYLTERRAYNRERQQTKIALYSNIGEPVITLNGEKLDGITRGETDVHYVVDVTLKKGVNIIEATATDGTKDKIEWFYQEESDNKLINNVERKEVHVGF